MKTRLLYFASLREKVGTGEEWIDLPADLATVGDLVTWQRQRSEAHADAFAEGNRIRIALDQQHASPAAEIGGAAEIAFFPPVTGG